MADPPSPSPTVLIVEDERNLADLYAEWLRDAYTVKTAYGGEAALDLLDESVDVVLLDRRMPGLSGDEVLAVIRDRSLRTRVAIVSAANPEFDVIEMGFDAYVVKPVSKDELHDVVETMLSRAAYAERVQELFRLMETKAVLEAEKSAAELASNGAYEELEKRIATLENEVESTLDEFDKMDFEAELRSLSQNNERTSDTQRSSKN